MENFNFMRKKILLAFCFVIIFSVLSFAAEKNENSVRVGILTPLGTTQDRFQDGLDKFREFLVSSDAFSPLINEKPPKNFISSIINEPHAVYFCNSLMSAIMNMKAGRIDEFILPESVGFYLVAMNSACKIRFLTDILSSKISFGFKEKDIELQREFDKTINEMKEDGTLDALRDKYIINFDARDYTSIKAQSFKDAPVIRIAVTGDMPPVDMFAGDGKPAGFNTAVLAEIGRRLEKNIEFVNVEAGGRSFALLSGRADVVFWYITKESNIDENKPFGELFKDVPEGVILSVPYYSWKNEAIITLKNSGGFFD